jgi:cobalt-precorrin-5B (C1)-methyltransferase
MNESSPSAKEPSRPRRDSSGRWGWTTGSCAAAAAKAALRLLCNPGNQGSEIDIPLPDGARVTLPLAEQRLLQPGVARAAVRKDAGDDPDVTDGSLVQADARWTEGHEVTLKAGPGVGRVTKKGLALAPGEPAINPIPRKMIHQAVREVTSRGVEIVIAIPGGEEVARRTFNPRLGVEGGLSILGTTGRVRPFSCQAVQDTLTCAISVAEAEGVTAPVFVPGHIGRRAAQGLFDLRDEQVIEVGNAWGYALDGLTGPGFAQVLALGHPGKLAKLAVGDWDTHSARSGSPLPWLASLAGSAAANDAPAAVGTVEGFFADLAPDQRQVVADAAARGIQQAIATRLAARLGPDSAPTVVVVLVNLQGQVLGQTGEVGPWKGKAEGCPS